SSGRDDVGGSHGYGAPAVHGYHAPAYRGYAGHPSYTPHPNYSRPGYVGHPGYGRPGYYPGRNYHYGYGYSTGAYWRGGYWHGGWGARGYYGGGFSLVLPILPAGYVALLVGGAAVFFSQRMYFNSHPHYSRPPSVGTPP